MILSIRDDLGGGRIAIIDVRNKKRGVTYVYESESYWDKSLKQPRSRRRLIGKRDPDTGEIVPTRRRKSASADAVPSDTEVDYRALWERSVEESRARDADEVELRRRVASLEIEVESLREVIGRVRDIVG